MQGAGERDLARRPGIANPLGIAPGADQEAAPFEKEQIHGECEGFAGLAAADLENMEVAADQADPDQPCQDAPEASFDGARPEKILRVGLHLPCLPRRLADLVRRFHETAPIARFPSEFLRPGVIVGVDGPTASRARLGVSNNQERSRP